MGDVVQFVPRAESDASANLAEFIRLAKKELTAFGGYDAWDSDKWKHGDTVVVFATKTAPLESYSLTPLLEQFNEFAKAYVRYSYSHKPIKNMALTVQALRCMEAAILDVCGRAEIAMLSAAVMDVSAAKCREFYSSAEVQCNTRSEAHTSELQSLMRISY